MKLWNDENEKFALMREKPYTPVVGDILDELGYYHQFLPPDIRPLREDMKLAGKAMTVLMTDVYGPQKKPFGLLTEARTAARIFRRAGFEVYGVACKVGAQPKTAVGIPEACEKVGKNMCNPILQAKLLNRAKTDLNVVIGLCVGHDSLFYKYAEALTTTLVTKDRVLGHNPAAALYQADSYYHKRLLGE